MNSFLGCSVLLLTSQQGCTYSRQVETKYEIFIAAEEAGFKHLYQLATNYVEVRYQSSFLALPDNSYDDVMFCVLDDLQKKDVLKCVLLVLYYSKSYSNDVTNMVTGVFKSEFGGTLIVSPENKETRDKGEYSIFEEGDRFWSKLDFSGTKVESNYYLGQIRTDLGRALYTGNCYSPNDRAADGSRCSKRSALSRPGGY
ncbi:hypothetical protein L1D14_26555 [Vibrio tubiashii]|uniref:hypothetical protein n=1 Tax=Vibrio tubiashii TaxID=29498 RepID=UPI001EFC3B2C|nr:hypothetical protein [Vibrio tubiashii]MCG9579768.1 hypothetical protein [Vibrio tubiashii]